MEDLRSRKMMKIFIFLVLSANVCALDILKMQKVAEDPKPYHVRQMEKAIIVQMTGTPSYQYLKKHGYPCCRF
jgi:hypothetical protein